MAELVDALDSKSSSREGSEGSTPSPGTKQHYFSLVSYCLLTLEATIRRGRRVRYACLAGYSEPLHSEHGSDI